MIYEPNAVVSFNKIFINVTKKEKQTYKYFVIYTGMILKCSETIYSFLSLT